VGGLPLAGGHWLSGCDETPGIIAVEADEPGLARVWRRLPTGEVEARALRFPSWFLTNSLDLLAHLHIQRLPAEVLRAAHGQLPVPPGLSVIELDADGEGEDLDDAYRYLVLAERLDEVETVLLETYNKRAGGQAEQLADLRGLVLVWPAVDQFLLLSGCTSFKGLAFSDLRRLQFDLETTGLNEERDHIFMVSLRDSSGWHECLDTSSMSEAALIARFVQLIRARDPDVLENHNIFAFDLPFLVRRASQLGVRLGLGRDGSEPRLSSDIFGTADRSEPFLRWTIAGRQVVDTQHAVRRYGAGAPDMRRHGLKEAARYFGFAKLDREYVPGPEVWSTFRTDPERVRRYAADDVEEVDGLSRRLLPELFGLARMLPRSYERIAADTSPAAIWEPLLVRAYLHEGRAISAPSLRHQRAAAGAPTELFARGVLGAAVRAHLQPLLPCILAQGGLRAANDTLAVMPTVLDAVLRSDLEGRHVLLQACFPYLADQRLFSDHEAAGAAAQIARGSLQRVLADLQAEGARVVETEADQVLLCVPSDWSEAVERRVAERARSYLPDGVHLTYAEHYAAVYVRGPRSRVTLGHDGRLVLDGNGFRPGRLERFAERFLRTAAPFVLAGDAVSLRRVFLDTVRQLREPAVPLEELCAQVTLHKSPGEYRRGNYHEEPYELLLEAGVRTWRVGQRVRYFRHRSGEARLLREGDALQPIEADTEHYVQRLKSLYCHQFAAAFRKEDFERVFRLPRPGTLTEDPEADPALALVRPIAETLPVDTSQTTSPGTPV
jgi:DNA polymerase elongation subunit (family B)